MGGFVLWSEGEVLDFCQGVHPDIVRPGDPIFLCDRCDHDLVGLAERRFVEPDPANSVHDSQVAIPLAQMTAERIANLYDLSDAAYDAREIREMSARLGHVALSFLG
jgi:hypothetical protein